MKILQIVNPVIPFPPTTIGGTERIVSYLIDELMKNGHEVTLMAHDESIVPIGVKLIPIGTYNNQKNTVINIWKHLLVNNYDVIHNHGRLIYFLPKIWSNVRKIHTFHMAELETKSFHQFSKLKARNLTFSPCGKWIQEKSLHLKGHWSFVNNGLPKNLYSYDCNELTDGFLIIICRMGKTKGVIDAIRLAKITNKKLIISGKIGDYPHEKEWFNTEIMSQCDGNLIKFVGQINDFEKNKLLNNALALIIPTIDSEAFNTTMLEANACGCPVISYRRFCFDEYIINGINGLKAENFDGLVDAVNNIYKIDRQSCRDYFEQKFTSRHMVRNYLKLYHNQI